MNPRSPNKQPFQNWKQNWFSSKDVYYFLIGTGIVLRLIQYLYNRSLWLDEASLALGLIDLNNSVFEPLPHNQVAPVLFLLIERGLIMFFGTSEFVLRAFPLICSIVSLFLIEKVSFLITKNTKTALLSLVFFVFSPLLLFYSSELKQYSSDVLVFLVLTYFALYNFTFKKKIIWLTIAGTVSIFLSNISGLILFYIFGLLLINQIVKRKLSLHFISSSVILLVAFAINYMLFIHHHPTRAMMVLYWDYAFMPLNPFNPDFWLWLGESFGYFFKKLFLGNMPSDIYNYGFIGLFFVFFIAGSFEAIKTKNFWFLYITIFPILLHLFLSGFKMYPFHNRLILYLSPVVFIQVSSGINFIHKFVKRKVDNKFCYVTYFLIIAGLGFPVLNNYPIEKEELKQSISYMEENLEPKDKIVVFENTTKQFNYYMKSGSYNFNENDISHSINLQKMKEFSTLNSSSSQGIWFIISHYLYKNTKQVEQFINELEKKGKIANLHQSTGSIVIKIK